MTVEERIRDRRHGVRVPVRFPVELQELDCVFQSTATDLSASGIKLEIRDPPPSGSEVDLTLRPPSRPALKFKARVIHATGSSAGLVFDLDDPARFEAAFDLFESLVIGEPALAIRLKQRPTSLPLTARIFGLPLEGKELSGAEHWLCSLLGPNGTTLAALRQSLAGEWSRMSHLIFALIEREAVSLQPPAPVPQPEPESAPARQVPVRRR